LALSAAAVAFGAGEFAVQLDGNYVKALAVQPDGKILVGGRIVAADGVPCEGFARLFPDGSADTAFNPAASLNLIGMEPVEVDGIRLQKDGKILATGWFLSGPEVMRFLPDGTVDHSFSMPPNLGFAEVIEPLPDGKVLVGGLFWIGAETTPRGLLRLNADGSIDETFTTTFADDVRALEVLDSGKVVVGGDFVDAGGTTSDYLVRLDASGAVDPTFVPVVENSVSIVVSQPDGKLLVNSFNQAGRTPCGVSCQTGGLIRRSRRRLPT
jgi:uncharacterized delta-60 repeat protein